MKIFLFLVMLLSARGALALEKLPGAAPPAGLKFELLADKTNFAAGEIIAVRMRFSSENGTFYVLSSGADWLDLCFSPSFAATDQQGKAVPHLRGPTACVFGGPLPTQAISPGKPYEQTAFLNQWLALDRPGKYTIRAHKSVGRAGDKYLDGFGSNPNAPSSAPLILEITPPDEAARQKMFERAAQMPRDDDGSSRIARQEIMRELRVVRDERALPFLARGLLAGEQSAQHAGLGLQNIPDATKVKAALLRVLDETDALRQPGHISQMAFILAHTEMRLQNPEPGYSSAAYSKAFRAFYEHWKTKLMPQMMSRVESLQPKEAAEFTVALMMNTPSARSDARLWRRLLRDASLIERKQQGSLALLLNKMPRDATLQALLRPVAMNQGLHAELRSAALKVLLLAGDVGVREVIFRDLASPSPLFDKRTHALLGSYKTRERAVLLLARMRVLARMRASADWQQREEAVAYLRDCGQAATLDELRAVFASLVKQPRANVLPIIEAVALNSPRAAFSLLKTVFTNRGRFTQFDRDRAYDLILKRLDLPEARAIIVTILRSGTPSDRAGLLETLASHNPPHWPERGLALLPHAGRQYVGEMIALAQRGPTAEVQAQARRALQSITHLPKHGLGRALQENPDALLKTWRNWWDSNRAHPHL